MTTVPTRIRELDSLRGIAAFAVLLFHFTYVNDAHRMAPFGLAAGKYGVELFFVISGFVIFMTLERSGSVRQFAVSRIARLFPAYWAAIFCTASVVWAAGVGTADNLPPTAAGLGWNLSMLQSFVDIPDIDNSYWTLAVELLFYAMVGTLLWVGRLGQIEWFCLIWLGVLILFRIAHRQFHFTGVSAPILHFLEYGQFFILGIVLYLARSGRARVLTLMVGLLALAISLFGRDGHLHLVAMAGYFAVTGLCALLVGLAAAGLIPLLNWPPLLFLGDISYPLYLTHQEIGERVADAAYGRSVPPLACLVLATTVVIAISWLIHKSVEVPGRRWLRSVLEPVAVHRPVAGAGNRTSRQT